jgi:chorismate mutase
VTDDPVLSRLREQVSELDRAILDAVNERLRVVEQIKAHKDANGIGFVDPDRERAMLEELRRANAGPLSDDGLRELLATVLDLTKREVAKPS